MKKVIACIDGSRSTRSVCDWAIWSAKRLEAPLGFLHVLDRRLEQAPVRDFSGHLGVSAQESLMEELSTLDERRSKIAMELGRDFLEHAKQRAALAGITQLDARQRHGTLVTTLVEMESELRLAVLGPHLHDKTLPRHHLDHTVENVVRSVRAPVLLADREYAEPRRFAVAFDGSSTGRKMIQTLATTPLLRELSSSIVMASEGTPQANAQADWARTILSQGGFSPEVSIVDGNAEEVLQAHVREHHVDLLVMGAYGHSRIRELIVGSTTTTMLRTSEVPVLILR